MLHPTFDRVIVETIDAPTQVKGIFIPEVARGPYVKGIGKVVAFGPGGFNKFGEKVKPSETLAIGDKVHYRNYAPMEIEHGGKKFLIMDLADVLAVEK